VTTLSQGSVPFRFPPALPVGQADNIAADGESVPVNATVPYQTLFMVASAADVSFGYTSLPLTLTYQNGTTAQATAAVSDWVLPGSTLPADEAAVYTNPNWVRHGQVVPAGQGELGGKDASLYVVSVPLGTSAGLRQVTLGVNGNFHIWAMTLADVPPIAPPTLSLAAATYHPEPGVADPLTVRLSGPTGGPVAGATVHLTATSPGVVKPATLTTNGSGTATSVLTDAALGVVHITATYGTLTTALTLRVTYPVGSGAYRSTYPGAPFSQEPINVATGNLVVSATDLTLPSVGGPLAFARTYNSLSRGSAPLGPGWSATDFTALTVRPTGVVTVTRSSGRQLSFAPTGSGTYQALTPTHSTLVKNADGTYTWTRGSGTQELFSPAGVLSTITTPGGFRTTLTYAAGRLVAVTDPSGQSLAFAYTASGRLATVTSPAGTVQYQYNAAGELAGVVLPGPRTWAYTDTAQGQLATVTNPNGQVVIRNTYDALGRIASQTGPLGGTWQYQYHPVAGATVVTNPFGDRTTYRYNGANQLTALVRPNGGTATFGYTAEGLLDRYAGPAGGSATLGYNPAGNLTQLNAGGATLGLAYNASGQITAFTNPQGAPFTVSYGANQAPRQITGTGGTVLSLAYGPTGEPTTVAGPNGAIYHLTWGPRGDLTVVTLPTGGHETMTYDAAGHLIQVITPTGDVVTLHRNAAGQLVGVTDRLGAVETIQRDDNGNPVAWTNALGQVTRATYNALNELTQLTTATGSTWEYTYYVAGRLIRATLPNGETVGLAYTADGHVASITYPHHTVTYAYDSAGRLVGMADPTGHTTFGYNPLGQLTSVTYPGVAPLQFTYGPTGALTEIQYPDGRTVQYGYNALGRLTTVATSWAGTTRYAYTAQGVPQSVYLPDGAVVQYTYAQGLLSGTRVVGRHGRTLWTQADHYTPGGLLAAVTTRRGPQVSTQQYAYDLRGELVAARTRGWPANTVTYRYNLVGERVQRRTPRSTTTYSYNADGAVVSATRVPGSHERAFSLWGRNEEVRVPNHRDGATTRFVYDTGGEMTRMTPPHGPSVRLTYNSAGQLTGVIQGPTTTRYQYNGLGWLTGSTTTHGAHPGSPLTYVRDPLAATLSSLAVLNVAGAPVATTVLGMARISTTTARGTTDLVTLPDGAVMGTLNPSATQGLFPQGSPYGRPTPGQPALSPWGYQGYRSLLPSSLGQPDPYGPAGRTLWQVGSRVYDPALAQYLTPDSVLPVPQYGYAANNPTTLIDPTGHEGIPGAIIGGVMGLVGGVLQATATPETGLAFAGTLVLDTVIGAATGGVADYEANPLLAYVALSGGNLVASVGNTVIANNFTHQPLATGLLSLPQLVGYGLDLGFPTASHGIGLALVRSNPDLEVNVADLGGLPQPTCTKSFRASS
jgi:RHS repeat-associated protein